MRIHDHPQWPRQPIFCGKTHDFSTKAGKSSSPAFTIAYEAWIKCLIPENQLFAFNLWEIKDTAFIKMLVHFLERRGHSKAKRALSKSSADDIIKKCYFGPKKDHDKTKNVKETFQEHETFQETLKRFRRFKRRSKKMKALFWSTNRSSNGTNPSLAR